MEVFIAGIIQGSNTDKQIHDQGYRNRLKDMLQQALPRAKVYCPYEEHPQSVLYEAEKAKQVFMNLMARAARADILVAYLPEASMGTAIELWQAYTNDKIVIVISPLAENWVTRFVNTEIFSDLQQFERWLGAGGLNQLLRERQTQ